MSRGMAWFSVLGYATAIAGIFPLDFANAASWIPNVVIGVVIAALVWAAARGHAWAGALFSVAIAFSIVAAIGEVWGGAPPWLRFGAQEAVTIWTKVADVVTVIFGVAAMAVYLRDRRRAFKRA